MRPRITASAVVAPLLLVSLTVSPLPPVAALPQTAPSQASPVPPFQNAPWTQPIGKDAEGFPLTLLQATEILFAQGLADPRGGEYRVITVESGNTLDGKVALVETHGWVFPADKDGKRFAACWNGLVYPVVAVKGTADLKADVEQHVKKHAERWEKSGRNVFEIVHRMEILQEVQSLALETPSLLWASYLLRLGEFDLARKVYALWDGKAPYGPSGDIQRDRYLHLAAQWAWSLYDRALGAYTRGKDKRAAADTAFLAQIQPLIEAEAGKRGYRTDHIGRTHRSDRPYLQFLSSLPTLRQETLRRVAEKPRPPLDWDALKKLPQTERIAELVRRMDDINARREEVFNHRGLERHPISEALIAEGDAAIEPLLDVLEKDERRTRLVEFGRDGNLKWELRTVKAAAFACFARITGVTEIGEGNRTNAALRAWWAKHRSLSPEERWFVHLADDGTPFVDPPLAPDETYNDLGIREKAKRDREESHRRRWYEAAARIVERGEMQRRGLWPVLPYSGPVPPLSPFDGESLRARQNPSVSDLLRKRALQISEPRAERSDADVVSGVRVALMLYDWKPNGRDTLLTLQEMTRRSLEVYNTTRMYEKQYQQHPLSGLIARLTQARLRLGDTTAAAEYEAWLLARSPEYFKSNIHSVFFALTTEPDNPALQRVADTLFNEADGRKNDWNQILATPTIRGSHFASELFGTTLLRYPVFRDLVVRRLADTTEAGFIRRETISWFDGATVGTWWLVGNTDQQPRSLRLCDRVALALQDLKGVPRFDALASAADRDRQCAAIAAYLNRYGAVLGDAERNAAPLYVYDPYRTNSHRLGPTFPIATRPATEADVRENRAIFTLSGAKVRVVADLPVPLPFVGIWKNDPNPRIARDINGNTVKGSRGYIWQAEEVYDGKKWVRYYGYVGPHCIIKVPAEEIEISDTRVPKK